MFCQNCIGSGIITGPGEYRGVCSVCSVCNGFGRKIIVNSHKNNLGEIMISKQEQDDELIKISRQKN